jgi:5-methylcytosine-specific restriction endonuclease McrA
MDSNDSIRPGSVRQTRLRKALKGRVVHRRRIECSLRAGLGLVLPGKRRRRILPSSCRDQALIAAGFTCCVCGEFRFYCDVHHMKPVSEGGTDDIRNLITLCPNDHRIAHRKGLTPAQLKRLWKRHTENVRVAVAAKDTLRSAQEVVIAAFMYEHCIEKPYDRESYVGEPSSTDASVLPARRTVAHCVVGEESRRPARRRLADVIGLYLNPPQHATVFCVDEKTAIQALDRLDLVLPLSPGRAERHGFEYYRHGTLSLYAALDTKTGRVHGKTTARHTSADFVFLCSLGTCTHAANLPLKQRGLAHESAYIEHLKEQGLSVADLRAVDNP